MLGLAKPSTLRADGSDPHPNAYIVSMENLLTRQTDNLFDKLLSDCCLVCSLGETGQTVAHINKSNTYNVKDHRTPQNLPSHQLSFYTYHVSTMQHLVT
jgi:hypothetical protein